jgi:YHS domain-containing protein
MKVTLLVTLLIIALASSLFVAELYAQNDHSAHSMEADKEKTGDDHSMHSMDSDKSKASSDKVRCALDGMMMKKAMMIPMEHGDETLYFCSEGQKDIFQKSPKRYLKKVKIHGQTMFLMNVLTMKEYMDMMQSMGMGKMAKKGGKNDTHWLSAYLVGDHQMELSGLAVKAVSASGKTSFQELKYDKMMKTYTGNVSLLEGGEYKLGLLLESEAIVVP